MKQRDPRRSLVNAVLGIALIGLLASACVGIAPASSVSPTDSGPGSVPLQSGPQTTVDVTIGPSKTKKPKHTPAPATSATSDEPTTQPTDTTSTTTTEPPTDVPTTAPAGSGFHLRSFILASFIILPINPKLDYTASPNYGEANLSAGFSPDPYSVGMTTGGNVDVSYLGSSCAGFATTAPDLRVNFGGGASLLRIYFVGTNGDPSMVVNDPYGNFYCVDDSFGTVNPTIDFNNPAGGSYDIWIGSYAANTTISGTLYLTENSGNHP